jgi:hypothetical protein
VPGLNDTIPEPANPKTVPSTSGPVLHGGLAEASRREIHIGEPDRHGRDTRDQRCLFQCLFGKTELGGTLRSIHVLGHALRDIIGQFER